MPKPSALICVFYLAPLPDPNPAQNFSVALITTCNQGFWSRPLAEILLRFRPASGVGWVAVWCKLSISPRPKKVYILSTI